MLNSGKKALSGDECRVVLTLWLGLGAEGWTVAEFSGTGLGESDFWGLLVLLRKGKGIILILHFGT